MTEKLYYIENAIMSTCFNYIAFQQNLDKISKHYRKTSTYELTETNINPVN